MASGASTGLQVNGPGELFGEPFRGALSQLPCAQPPGQS